MGRLLALIMGIAILGYLGFRTMYGRGSSVDDAAPKERLDNAKGAAQRIEDEQQKRVDDTLNKANE